MEVRWTEQASSAPEAPAVKGRVLEADAIDRGDLAGALGPDTQINLEIADQFYANAATWLWERLRGYPSLRRRKQLLAEKLGSSAGRGA